ncbi:hypothetical protein FGO68_gene8827 [Halteria grandinella]|uniref:Transmembrane protein n=1 Tax=Halteria grandinella TaxID=5974 RepID=A0A8J8NK59_HALGN|nr:hypothetical protein FGO68_gene8827 [Halteria grandinella]
MVFENTVKLHVTDPAYQNETWRARHHFKEEHQHDPPQRRNRDFKPVNYGSFRGILNYKRAEPFESLKNLKDLKNEHAHHPTKWAKCFLFGAMAGATFGYAWFVIRPFQSFPIRKLLQATGDRPWSGRYLRWAKNVVTPYAMIGGSVALTYQLVFDYLRHHEESNNDRPLYFDHLKATTLITTVGAGIYGGLPRYWFTGFFVGSMLFAPMIWWLRVHGKFNAQNRPANIFYDNNVTKEEVERIRHLDEIESLGSAMLAAPGYGYFSGDPKHV